MEQKTSLNHQTPPAAKPLLAAGVVSEIADKYEEQVRLEKIDQKDKRQKIKELEQLISNSMNKPIYKMLYKPEYGDYRQFVEDVAAELRRRNACC
ncbi:MAG: hypothetical protein B6D44_11205 [Ignavibacteriales bacterium UTCHB2]|jgi:hypothetical protein|nr:MAG: hypothetical protein BWY38_00164 [Ignavibacteria bacterium ADurb.Bin266]OQY71890.1 MAG: hypothetical protein B6D44_11205 [Ignavibacteriales bacterium UTCHB2]HQI40692.1 hypothetical protein [Ignavibacteriaceae bacterium]